MRRAPKTEWPLNRRQIEVTGSGFDIRPLDDVAAVVRSAAEPPPMTLQRSTADGPLEMAIVAPVGAEVIVETTTELSALWTETQRVTGQGEANPVRFFFTLQPTDQARFWRVNIR